MTDFLAALLDQPPWLILTVSGLVVFGECALLVGMVLPGETVAVLAGAAAALGRTSLVSVLVVVLARRAPRRQRRVCRGPPRRSAAAPPGHPPGVGASASQAAEARLRLRGGLAVVLGRWTPVRPLGHALARGHVGYAVPEVPRVGPPGGRVVVRSSACWRATPRACPTSRWSSWFGTVGAVLLGGASSSSAWPLWSWRRTAGLDRA